MRYQITSPAVADPVSLDEVKLHLRVDISTDDELIRGLIKSAVEWCEKYENAAYMVRTIKLYLDKFYDVVELPLPPLLSVSSITYVDTAGDTQTLSTSVYGTDTYNIPGRVYLDYNQSWPTTRSVINAVCITYVCGSTTTFTANSTTDILTVKNAIFSDDDVVRVTTDQGDLPASLAIDTDYYVINTSGSTLQLSATSGGAAIDLSDTGSGTHYIALSKTGLVPDRIKAAVKLIVGHLYEHREENSEMIIRNIPFAAKNLLMERVF